MSANLNISVIDNPVKQNGGLVWNRLHSEREAICDALVKNSQPDSEAQPVAQSMSKEDAMCIVTWHEELLQARMRKIDDALDRLMSGSYGECIRCGKWIEDTKLEFDPAIAFCISCWERQQTRIGADTLTGNKRQPQQQPNAASNSLEQSVETKSSDTGLSLKTLAPFDTIQVRTLNSDYRIFLLDPSTGRALVEGGLYFVEPVEAKIAGSTEQGSTINDGVIDVGLRLEMWVRGKLARTSRIQSYNVERLIPTEGGSYVGG